jgi:type IV pilus biogenesis protein PilP
LTRDELAQIRPRLRPEVEKAADEADETATAQAVDTSLKPRPRPDDFNRTVRRADRATPAQSDPVQTAAVAPRTVAPSVPSRANVAREATVRNALRLNRVNLIGVYGKPSSRRALIRLSNGRYKKVQVGDRLDGGRVQAIGESELRYTKGGRPVTLKMPRG